MVIQRKGRNLKIYGVSKGSKNSRDSQHSQHPPNSQQFGMMTSKLTLNEQAYSTFMVNVHHRNNLGIPHSTLYRGQYNQNSGTSIYHQQENSLMGPAEDQKAIDNRQVVLVQRIRNAKRPGTVPYKTN
jgi:hypothetical protein